MKRLLHIAILLLFGLQAYSQAGTLDPSFNGTGKVFTSFFYDYGFGPEFYGLDEIRALAVQPDGKIVAAGFSYNGLQQDIALARYNTDGSLDNSFGGDGQVNTNLGTDNGVGDIAYAIAIQADGKIVVAGTSDDGPSPTLDFVIIRYNADGSIDNSFGNNGIVFTGFGGANAIVYALCIQPDGKILAAGSTNTGPLSTFDFAIVRYNTDGSLDNSFDGDGKLPTSVSPQADEIYAIALQPDGKIVVAGYGNISFINKGVLMRFNTDGSPDNSFDGDGMVITAITSNESYAYDMAIQPDGKIVIAGHAHTGVNWDFFVARYNTDGSMDNSFDGDGKVITNMGTLDDFAYTLAIQLDGKILVGGTRNKSTAPFSDFAIARYLSNGSLDNSFDGDGKAFIDMTGGNEQADAMVLANNRIYLSGHISPGTLGYYVFGIAAVRPGGILLPLTLAGFSAEKAGNDIQLRWETVSEQNTEVFKIERSRDGVNYSGIGEVAAAGNSASAKSYSYLDKHAVSGTNYYRLKMVDIDQKYTYSKIVAVKWDGIDNRLILFPSPVKDLLQVRTGGITGDAVWILSDMTGRIIRKQNRIMNGNEVFTINVAGLASGQYCLVVHLNNGVLVRQFVKN